MTLRQKIWAPNCAHLTTPIKIDTSSNLGRPLKRQNRPKAACGADGSVADVAAYRSANIGVGEGGEGKIVDKLYEYLIGWPGCQVIGLLKARKTENYG